MVKAALLIGVSEYAAGLNPLPKAVDDIDAMKTVLENPKLGGFSEITVLPNPKPFKMQFEIEKLFSERSKDDLILLFFSGHGVKDDRGNLYFATAITRKTPEGELVKSTAVPSRFIHDIMSNSRSRRQVVILDCCFSGAFAKGLSAKDDGSVNVKEALGGEGRVVLTSSAATQYSFEQADTPLSVYTRYLVEGISTGAADADSDGTVSIGELHEYAKRKVHEAAPAMEPKIYAVEEGFRILLTQSPVLDPVLVYRKEVEQCASRGKISAIGRKILDELREKLLLPEAQTAEIEAAVFKPYQEYEGKLKVYKQVLKETLAKESPLSDDAKAELKRYQNVLGLRDKDVAPIKTQILLKPQASGASQEVVSQPSNSSQQPYDEDAGNTEAPSSPVISSPSAQIFAPSSSQPPIPAGSPAAEILSPPQQSLFQRGLAPSSIDTNTNVANTNAEATNAPNDDQRTVLAVFDPPLAHSSSRQSVPTSRTSLPLVPILAGAVAMGLAVGGGLYVWTPIKTGVTVDISEDVASPKGSEITSPPEESADTGPLEEIALKADISKKAKELGLQDFWQPVTNDSFHALHPELKQRKLAVEGVLATQDAPLRMEWLKIGEDWLTFIEKQHLSPAPISKVGKYTLQDEQAQSEAIRKVGLPAIALYDLADARFHAMFANSYLVGDSKKFIGSDNGKQLWKWVTTDTLDMLQGTSLGENSILKRVSLKEEPIFESGTLKAGEGKVYLVEVPQGSQLLSVSIDNAPPNTTQLSIFQPVFLADASSVPKSDDAIAHDTSETHKEVSIDQGGTYSIVIVSTTQETIDYRVSMSVEADKAKAEAN